MTTNCATLWKVIWRASLVCVVLTANPHTSSAQSAGNKAAAEALFDQGRLLMQSGDYAQACQKFEASQKLDEGIGTLLYLADCYERTGRTASAWAVFKEAASVAGAQGQESRQKLANQRAKSLEPALVKVVIEVAKGNLGLLGFEVRIDGAAIPPAQFGLPVPIDPGEHRIEASAPGKRSYSDVAKVVKGEGHVTIPLLEDLPATTAPPPGPTVAASNTSVATPPYTMGSPERDVPSGRTQRVVSYVVGGAGVVAVGVGSYFGLTAIHNHNLSKSACADSTCYQDRLGQYNDAVNEARGSTIAFLAGGVLLATGLVLYLTAPDGKPHPVQASAAVAPNQARLTIGGAW